MSISIIDILMPDDRKLFAVTQWVLRAGIVVTSVLIGLFVLGVAAMIFGLATSRLPLDWIAHATGVAMTAGEIGRIALTAHTAHPPRFAARGRKRQRRRSLHRGECRGTRPRRLAPPRPRGDRHADQAD